jgi:hypothetical protein
VRAPDTATRKIVLARTLAKLVAPGAIQGSLQKTLHSMFLKLAGCAAKPTSLTLGKISLISLAARTAGT